jgi:hypothetical protein
MLFIEKNHTTKCLQAGVSERPNYSLVRDDVQSACGDFIDPKTCRFIFYDRVSQRQSLSKTLIEVGCVRARSQR